MNYGSIDNDTRERRLLRALRKSRAWMSNDEIHRETRIHVAHTYAHGINVQLAERGQRAHVVCKRHKDRVWRYRYITGAKFDAWKAGKDE